MNVAIIGASNKPDRYSYKALKLLQEKGHDVYPVHVRIKEIEGTPVYGSLKDIQEPIDTISLYVNADISSAMQNDILNKKPRRIIFNPSAENPQLEKEIKKSGITSVKACTLVLLKTGQF